MAADRRLSIAPMLDRSDRHFRYLLRLISKKTRLYSEMVVDRALIHGEPSRHLDYHPAERPLALQIASAEPNLAARAVARALPWGYDEVNLNVGCPSQRVQRGGFGVVLMRDPKRVSEIVRAVYQETGVRLSIKHRVGLDGDDGYSFLARFVETVALAGAEVFIVHARKAWTRGLDPKANRSVPPLQPEKVYRLKRDFPELTVVINGGMTVQSFERQSSRVDGVMVGRAAWERPWSFAVADRLLGATTEEADRARVLSAYQQYLEEMRAQGVRLARLLKPLYNLFKGEPGGRLWRRRLHELAQGAQEPSADLLQLAPLEATREK